MSDFGTLLTATKKDRKSLSSEELTDLSEGLAKINSNYKTTLGEDFSSAFKTASDDTIAIVQLSEYYYSGDPADDEGLFEFVEETELDQAHEIAEKLAATFPDFEFEAATEEW